MAYGQRCKYCGWQETNHAEGALEEEDHPEVKYKGRKHSLATCPGFRPENFAEEESMLLGEIHNYGEGEKYPLPQNVKRRHRKALDRLPGHATKMD